MFGARARKNDGSSSGHEASGSRGQGTRATDAVRGPERHRVVLREVQARRSFDVAEDAPALRYDRRQRRTSNCNTTCATARVASDGPHRVRCRRPSAQRVVPSVARHRDDVARGAGAPPSPSAGCPPAEDAVKSGPWAPVVVGSVVVDRPVGALRPGRGDVRADRGRMVTPKGPRHDPCSAKYASVAARHRGRRPAR